MQNFDKIHSFTVVKDLVFTSRTVSWKNSYLFVSIVGAKHVLLVNTSAVGAKVP